MHTVCIICLLKGKKKKKSLQYLHVYTIYILFSWLTAAARYKADFFFSLIPWESMQPTAAAWVLACRTGMCLYFWKVLRHVSLLRNVGRHKLFLKYIEKSKEEASGGEINFWKGQNRTVRHSCSSSRYSLLYISSVRYS